MRKSTLIASISSETDQNLNFPMLCNQFSDQMGLAAKLKTIYFRGSAELFGAANFTRIATNINRRSCSSAAPKNLLSIHVSFPQFKPQRPLKQTTSAFAGVSPRCAGRRTISFFPCSPAQLVSGPLTAHAWPSQMRFSTVLVDLRNFAHSTLRPAPSRRHRSEVRRLEGPGLVLVGGRPIGGTA